MDRFIVFRKSRRCSLLFHLKSNMDRFIAGVFIYIQVGLADLKSNMDRFIESKPNRKRIIGINLKSNMDRFIVNIPFLMMFRSMI